MIVPLIDATLWTRRGPFSAVKKHEKEEKKWAKKNEREREREAEEFAKNRMGKTIKRFSKKKKRENRNDRRLRTDSKSQKRNNKSLETTKKIASPYRYDSLYGLFFSFWFTVNRPIGEVGTGHVTEFPPPSLALPLVISFSKEKGDGNHLQQQQQQQQQPIESTIRFAALFWRNCTEFFRDFFFWGCWFFFLYNGVRFYCCFNGLFFFSLFIFFRVRPLDVTCSSLPGAVQREPAMIFVCQ